MVHLRREVPISVFCCTTGRIRTPVLHSAFIGNTDLGTVSSFHSIEGSQVKTMQRSRVVGKQDESPKPFTYFVLSGLFSTSVEGKSAN